MLRYDAILRDPVHGDVPLTHEEMRVLDTVEMQRLRHVRQLGAAYLVYPGAQHSRFEHSVGTAHLAGRIAEAVNQLRDRQSGAQLDGYDDHALRVVRLAALVHDATHLPFGHNIEDQTGLLPRHDVPERFTREQGCTGADWVRDLPGAVSRHRLEQLEAGHALVAIDGGGRLQLQWHELPPRRIALLRMPRLQVDFRFDGTDAAARSAFMRYFDLFLQRGGG